MSWHTGPIFAFDIESTGVDPENDRIVTATIVKVCGSDVDTLEWIVNPGVEIPQAAIDVHGVTNERARAEGVAPQVAVAEIFAELDAAWYFDRPVVIYNAPYDLTMLDRELRRHCGRRTGLGPVGPVIDPFVIDRRMDPYRKGKRTLSATCEHYNVRLDNAHEATADALAAARLAWRLAQAYPEHLADLSQVNALQEDWKEEQAIRLQDWFRSQGRDENVRREWPLIPAGVEAVA